MTCANTTCGVDLASTMKTYPCPRCSLVYCSVHCLQPSVCEGCFRSDRQVQVICRSASCGHECSLCKKRACWANHTIDYDEENEGEGDGFACNYCCGMDE